MRTKNVLILVIVAVVLLSLAGFTVMSMAPANNTTNNTTDNSTLNVTNNTTLSENNTTQTQTTAQKTTTKSSKKSQSSQSKSSDSEVKEAYFTVSENEKGQNEGMEPGRYVERYTSDGPISVEKID